MEYKVFDASKEPADQGLELGVYDLIIASNVIHATAVLKTTLTHVRKLLAPRGRFFLQELAPADGASKLNNLIMGILPGWWLGEADGRPTAPSVSTERWDKELQSAGFAPIEAVVYDDPDLAKHIGMNIIAHPAKVVDDFRAVTLLHTASQGASAYVQQVEDVLLAQDFIVDRCTVGQPIPQNQDIISLLELEEPFIYNLKAEDFEALKAVLADIGSANLLWVTRPSQLDVEDPRFSQTLGFARTVRSELSIPFATLELDVLNATAFDKIVKVFNKLQETASDPQPEYEYILKDDIILTGRYHWINTKKELSLASPSDSQALKLDIGRPGLLTSLGWTSYALETLGADEVVVAPRSVGMNFRDLLVAMGLVDGGSVGLGLECAGIVTAVGSNVEHLQVGDRVMAMGQNYFSTETITLADHVVKIPDTLAFDDAATMPCVYITVIHALLKVANVQKGQTILIQSACGGVGLAAIQICQMAGLKVCLKLYDEDLTDSF
jgi:hypothetical protein